MLKTSPVLSSATSTSSPSALRHGHASASRSSLSHDKSFPTQTASSFATQASSQTPLSRSSQASIDTDSAASYDRQKSPPGPAGALPTASASESSVYPPTANAASTSYSSGSSFLSSSATSDPNTQRPGASNKRRGSETKAEPESSSHQQDGTKETTSKKSKPMEPPPAVLPSRYELCPIEDLVECIANMLTDLINTNDAIGTSSGGLTRFHSRTAPGISVRDYLGRLARHATLTPPLLLVMVYFIDRLCLLYQDFTINTLTVHRFLITAATVASKGLSDAFWNNTTYARVGGVRLEELKMLELEFLYRVDWKIIPTPDILVAYYQGLVERTPGYILEPSGSDGGDDEDDDAEDNAGSGGQT